MTIRKFPEGVNIDGGDGLGKIDDNNSSSSALNAGNTFTGTWTDVSGFSSVVVAVATDQDGSFSVQYSTDATNVDSTLTRYYRTGKINVPHRFTNTRRYMRVVFTNDSASNQTYFRLQTELGDKEDLNAPLDSTLAQDFDATVVRPTDFFNEVAQGVRQGWTTWNKWGYNPDIDTAAAEDIWSIGGTFTQLSSAETMDLVSTSANDTSAGTGARSVIIYGVDANYMEQTEVVTLNGTTPVTTSNTWLGINRVAIYLAGSTGYNEGDINVTATTATTNQAQIPATEGSTQQALFFVPAQQQAYLDWMLINIVKTSGGATPTVTVKMYVTSLVSNSRYEVFRHIVDTSVENTVELTPSQPFVVGEKSLIKVQAETDQNNTAVSVRFSGVVGKQVGAT